MRTTNQVLVALAIKKLGQAHAYAANVGKLIALATENPQFNRGGVAQTLATLEGHGWASATRVHYAVNGRQRAFFRLTAKGEKALQAFAHGARYLSEVETTVRGRSHNKKRA